MRWLAWRPMQSGPLIRRQALPDTKASTQSDPLRRQQLPPNTKSPSADGALCRPLIGARSPSCQWGREQPPGLERVPTPAPARRVAHAPMSVPQCSRVLALICEPNVRVLSRANAPQIPRDTHRTISRLCSPEHRPSHDQDRAVLGAVKALAALDPTGYGLDGACAQLAGRIYVTAK
jgi:hypothetical protein